jgi:branched-chain amino acid transport system permease protein
MAVQAQDIKAAPSGSRARPRFEIWVALPFVVFVIAYCFIPRFADERILNSLISIGILVLLALGLNLLMGYAGQISLGHAAFYGMGAYTSAIVALQPVQSEVIPGFSAGVGVMAATAALMSLTRLSGWKLAAGVGALFVLSWACRAFHAGLLPTLAIHMVGMMLLGVALRVNWYTSAAIAVTSIAASVVCKAFLESVLRHGGTSPWIGMVVGVLITGLIAYLIGAQVLRLKGHYLAMGTLAFGVVVEIIFKKWVAVTGGSSDGIPGIPTIAFVDGLPRALIHGCEWVCRGKLGPLQQYYYLVWLFVFFALLLAVNIIRSRVGRAFRAVHGSEQAAESLGVDTGRYKVQVFVLSAALASIAGSLYAHKAPVGYVSPTDFSFMVSVQILVIVVIGGLGSVWGAVLGAAAIEFLKDWIMTLNQSNVSLFGLVLKGLDPIVFGAILMGVMMLLPQGLVKGLSESVTGAIRGAASVARRRAGPVK